MAKGGILMFESYNLENFGKRVRDLRQSLGYTQKEVHENTGIGLETIRRLEKGERLVKFDTLTYLSLFYKIDLLEELRIYSSSNKILRYYDRLDDIIVSYDYQKLMNLSNDFEKYIGNDDENTLELFKLNTINQFKQLIKGITYLFSGEKSTNNLALDNFLNSLQITIPNFSLDNFKDHKYNVFEMRILLIIGVTLNETENHKKSNEILIFIITKLNFDKRAVFNEKKSIIKTYFNISYNYNDLYNHKKALEYANRGIEYCKENHLLYNLNHLYYRKGIAEYLLGKDEKIYMDSLHKAIHVLEIQGQYELAKVYNNVTKDTYNININ